MRVVYLGTPAAAVPPLKALLSSGHQVVGVVTRPDRPRDHRGGSPAPSPVKQVALDAGLPVLQPERGRDPALPGQLAALAADVGVSCAFGFLLPPPVLAVFPHGIVNLHFSLLPGYRGAAPVQRALLNGVEDGSIRPRPQPRTGASLAPKIDPAEARLDFGAPAARVVNAVRAFTPSPGAWTTFRGRRLKVARARAVPEGAAEGLDPGRLRLGPGGPAGARLLAGAGGGAVELVTVQPEGRRPMSGVEFARGARLGEEEWLGR